MHIVLLATTRNRTAPLRRLLDSLARQEYRDFSLLLGDQNPPGLLDELLAPYAARCRLRVTPLAPCGLSAARNALLPLARGEFIALTDDDCWYAPDSLALLARYATAYPEAGAFVGTGAAAPPPGQADFQAARPLSRYTVYNRAPSWCIFLRAEAVRQVGDFDPDLGLGASTPWQSGEETDYLLRVLRAGFPVYRAPSLRVFHEPMGTTTEDLRKIQAYGMGRMYVLRKHRAPAWFVLLNLVHPLARLLGELPSTGLRNARARLAACLGRCKGLYALLRRGSYQNCG